MIARPFGLLLLLAAAVAAPSSAQIARPILADAFAIGDGALCEAQSRVSDPALAGSLDRAWSITCRDAGAPVGQMYAFTKGKTPIDPRLARARQDAINCADPRPATLADVGTVTITDCRITANGLPYRITRVVHGRFTYVTQGLVAYQAALDLAIRSVITNRIVAGKVSIATLGDADASSFARQRAADADPQLILAEGYRRNNAGSYAESAAFFEALALDLAATPAAETPAKQADRLNRRHEALVNRALQRSDLGQFDEADSLFAEAAALPTSDLVQLRLRRNFEAIDRLNRRDFGGARAIIDRPLPNARPSGERDGTGFVITAITAAGINSATTSASTGIVRQETSLSPTERAAILDAQAIALRGIAHRLGGDPAQAERDLRDALAAMLAVREGRVTSITRLRAQTLAELGRALEAQGRSADAEAPFVAAIDLLQRYYPETTALNGARAQYAAYLARSDRRDAALALYGDVIATTVANQGDLTGVTHQMEPYFALLAGEISARPDRVDDLFVAAQTIVRPGAASTLEQLARALSGGSDVGARLFRQSLSLSRDIERARIALGQQQAAPTPDAELIAAEQRKLDSLQSAKQAAVTQLAAYPRYRAIDKATISLADLRTMLRPGEAYFKMTRVGDALYAIYADQAGTTGYRMAIDAPKLAAMVQTIRESISTLVNGTQATYPFDIQAARSLYVALMGPIAPRLANVKHLIFEPDAAMLELPPNLLVTDQASVDRYIKRRDAGGDDFDFSGVAWLGRDRGVSTALSARAFRATREAPPAAGSQRYIGFGENALVTARPMPAALTTGVDGQSCRWPISAWGTPISATELRKTAQQLGAPTGNVVTGAAFTDEALTGRSDLNQFHIVHFATHGLVSPPQPGCPADPALLTSFGDQASDGLLDFGEIFALNIDADLVILSACDTASSAGRAATRAAGLTTGGTSALDGLVRAFIGAGGRSVVASHWPAPDQFDATQRLFTALFGVPPDTSTAEALRRAQQPLMDNADTSHPFYWAGFAIIGDGGRPIVSDARTTP